MVPSRRSLPWTRRLLGWLVRRLQLVSDPVQVDVGPEWRQDVTVAPSYPAVNSMGAFGSFPWVVAAANAIATDIAGLPLVAQRGRGDRVRRIPNHGGLQLLRKPAADVGPTLWRRQLILDLLLAGNAYLLKVRAAGSGRIAALVRLEPELVEVLPGDGHTIRGYRYTSDASAPVYDAKDVVHIRQTSWRSGTESLFGQGAIEPLRTELTGEHAAAHRWQEEAGRGRPGLMISAKDGTPIKPDVGDKLLRRIQSHIQQYGAVFTSASLDVTQMPFSARDMEFAAARAWTRDAVLAVFGAVGTRVGLPNANYASAREAMQVYWQNLIGLIALIEDGLAEIAEDAGRSGDRIVHDTSGVEALQESRSDRLDRAVTLKREFGLTAAAALAYEGFDDIPEDAFDTGRPDEVADPSGRDDTTDDNVVPFPGTDTDTAEREAPSMIAKEAGGTLQHSLICKFVEAPEVEVGQAPRFRFVASTSSEDRHGDIVRQNWRLEHYQRDNPVILWNHDHGRLPIGRALLAQVEGGQLMIDFELDPEDDFAMKVAGKIRRRIINTGSVGFISHEMGWREDLDKDHPEYKRGYGMVLDDNELLEFSITSVQSNRDAVNTERRAAFEKRQKPAPPAGDLSFLTPPQAADGALTFLEQ